MMFSRLRIKKEGGNRMKRLFGTAIAGLCFAAILPALPSGQKSHMVTVMLFKTPPLMVSVVSAGPDAQGNIVGTQTGGIITSQFPEATVLLRLGGPADFSIEKIQSVIKKNFIFQCGDVLSKGLPADYFGKRVFVYDEKGILTKSGTMNATIDWSELSLEKIEFNLNLVTQREESWILAFRFELAPSGDLKEIGKSRFLRDEVIGLKMAEPILIGFPYNDPQKGKIIYWLAFCIDEANTRD